MNRDVRVSDDVALRGSVALGMDEVAVLKAERVEVGKQLAKIGEGKAGWLLGLVLRVNDRGNVRAVAPDEVGFHPDAAAVGEHRPDRHETRPAQSEADRGIGAGRQCSAGLAASLTKEP